MKSATDVLTRSPRVIARTGTPEEQERGGQHMTDLRRATAKACLHLHTLRHEFETA